MKVSLHNTMAKYINMYSIFTLHVAADWADIFDTLTKQEKTYLKPHCTPFPGNMSFNPETVAKRCAHVNLNVAQVFPIATPVA